MFRHSLLCLVMRSRLSCRAPLSCCGLPCTPLARPSCSALMLSPRCHICHLMRSCLSLDTRPVPLVLLYTRIVGATCIMLKMMLIFCMYSKAPFKNCLRGQAAAHQVYATGRLNAVCRASTYNHRMVSRDSARPLAAPSPAHELHLSARSADAHVPNHRTGLDPKSHGGRGDEESVTVALLADELL